MRWNRFFHRRFRFKDCRQRQVLFFPVQIASTFLVSFRRDPLLSPQLLSLHVCVDDFLLYPDKTASKRKKRERCLFVFVSIHSPPSRCTYNSRVYTHRDVLLSFFYFHTLLLRLLQFSPFFELAHRGTSDREEKGLSAASLSSSRLKTFIFCSFLCSVIPNLSASFGSPSFMGVRRSSSLPLGHSLSLFPVLLRCSVLSHWPVFTPEEASLPSTRDFLEPLFLSLSRSLSFFLPSPFIRSAV